MTDCADFAVEITEEPVGSGNLLATPTGGAAPFTYIWLPNEDTGSTITASGAGTYSVQVTDANGCITYDEIEL